jgi:hypothetical protein
VEHGGAIDGFIATTSFFPTDSIGIIVLSNQDSREIPAIVRNIVTDRVLQLKRSDWNREYLASAAKARKASREANAKVVSGRNTQTKPSHALNAYEGIYNHPGYGNMDVFVRNDSLFASTTKQQLWLMHWHYDFFVPFFIEPGEKVDTSNKGAISFRFNTNLSGDIESMNAYGMEAPSIELVFKKTPRAKALTRTELEAYTGEYDLGPATAKVYLKGESTMFVEVPGQPPYELIYTGNHRFAFKAPPGFALQFEKKEGEKASAVTFLQPHGNFKAARKQ